MITIYTDGSAKGNPGPGGWGAIVASGDRVVELGGSEPHTTNNRMELAAAIRSLEFVYKLAASTKPLEARIFTDSEYVMKGITLWVKNWQLKGWKTAAKKPVLNQDLWQELLKQTEGRDIKWNYVAGHTGVHANERCDEIATSFADSMPVSLYDGPKESYLIHI
ncbi:MAG: ribonuclease HI [bacterium]|nr:ribonuclease HI [bacterium]